MNKKKKDQTKLKVEDQANYVDSSRNLAVELDSKDLRMALKNFKREVVEIFFLWLNYNNDMDDII